MRKITNEELNRPSAGEFAAMEKMPVAVVLDNVRSLQNVGAFFRTGDAFAVERIALCGITATPPNRDIHKTALGAELTVPWTYHKTTEECIARLRAGVGHGHDVVGGDVGAVVAHADVQEEHQQAVDDDDPAHAEVDYGLAVILGWFCHTFPSSLCDRFCRNTAPASFADYNLTVCRLSFNPHNSVSK